ncbi:Bud site selection protein bud4 [Saxophila tyrrhenica]|uniref:Bud site selection protein bud4 n=1 Tax=Saxophila tyrrhenica TaxID=1690608 RepID=A0AAV9PLX4_9PEZI|nr:Bud site selection protein bud4 [Saxophila tyrrhenica]
MVRQVQPLRISKNPPSSNSNNMSSAPSRPLAEISSTERRRNSPSYNQATKVSARGTGSEGKNYTDIQQKMIVSHDSSPYTENSPPPSFLNKPSPRDFWSGRDSAMSHSRLDSENTPERSPSPSPHRRPSVERLKQANRVRNSNIFALESKDAYDPNSLPIVERPSANRPLSQSFVTNSFTRMDSLRKENNPFRSPEKPTHKRSESQTTLPYLSPTKAAAGVPLPVSPDKQSSPSPTKSALARTSQFGLQSSFDPESGAWSDDERVPTPRALHRHAKSVTFHEEPPVINEYEQQTPEPSVSVASDREGSWDSDDFYDEDISFDRGSSAEPMRDDSFDADLENADKTPVVLPEDWSRMSPDEARNNLASDEDDVFDAEEHTQRALLQQHGDRIVSDASDNRPLPPLPGFMSRDRRDSNGLSDAAERAAHSPRNLPSPPKRASCSKEDILKMTANSTLSIQDRLQLMGDANDSRPSSKSSHGAVEEQHEELTITNLDTGERLEMQVTETEVGDDSMLADFAPPRISRESILAKVRGTKYDYDDEDDDEVDQSEYQLGHDGRPSIAELARMDPDQPVPSREDSRETSDIYDLRAATAYVDQQEDVYVKPEPADDEAIDMDAIPEAPVEPAPHSPSCIEDYDRQSSVLRHDMPRDDSEEADDDTASRYSSVEPDAESTMIHAQPAQFEAHDDGKETLDEAMELLTVKDYSEPSKPQQPQAKQGGFLGLPSYSSADDDYDFGMKDWITPSPPADNSAPKEVEMAKTCDVTANVPNLQPSAEFSTPPLEAPSAEDTTPALEAPPTEREVSPPGTPESVIHTQDAERDISPVGELPSFHDEDRKRDSDPGVPERVASIKTGGKLKTRKSASRADMEAMAEQRRLVSGEIHSKPVPTIPAHFQMDENADTKLGASEGRPTSSASAASPEAKTADVDERERQKQRQRRKSRKSGGRMDLDLGLDTSTFSLHADEGDDGLGLEKEFARVIEGSKVGGPYGHYTAGTNGSTRPQKGYLMRQNTKLVVATNRNFSGESDETVKSGSKAEPPMSPSADAGAFERPTSAKGSKSPRKPSAEQFMKTEPWNGKQRRKSLRNASALKDAPFTREAAPPMPGQESVALGVVDEDYAAGSANLDDDVGEGVERGRLFVKVVGVKDLDLPMPRNDRVDFQLTLDNGLHCVTTTSLELGKSAPIGQEFELVVLDDLEFQLTLTTQLPPPPAKHSPTTAPSSPTKSLKSSKAGGAFSRFLSSPKKRAEKERLEREAAAAEERRAQEDAARRRLVRTPGTWDLLHSLVDSSSGSFARAYVNLKSHEQLCFGRQLTVDIPCYNEWALEEDPQVVNSVRSKRGAHAGPVRRPPYVVGLLELQLLYVPKPRGAGDEDMPKSMSSAVREMNKAKEVKEVVHEGFLSQQGGDCAHWRRRFFRLSGPRLTAYHEHTNQKRAVINLTKASRLVDDKRTLVANPSPSKSAGKGRRKSAFAEEDEGYAYVEEGFRVRFANGETIDFYADNKGLKEQWMDVLGQVVGKAEVAGKKMGWTDLVLAKERAGVVGGEASQMKGAGVGGTDVKDFSPPTSTSTTSAIPPQWRAGPERMNSYARKPVPGGSGAKSAPTSPMKGQNQRPTTADGVLDVPAARPRTPPMKARSGHRSRDAVRSMIF